MTRASQLRDQAMDLAKEFRETNEPHRVAQAMCSWSEHRAELVFLAIAVADALDAGHRADLLSQLRAIVRGIP